jgi:glucans biosynthesis protein C
MTHGNPVTLQPSFLWFLWYLLILDGLAILLFVLAPKLLQRAGAAMGSAISRPLWGMALLAIPTVLALWPQASWTAAPRPATFVPDLPLLAYYTLFFGLGAALCTHRHLVRDIGRNAWGWTACALATTLPAAALFTLHNSPAFASRVEVHGLVLLVYSLATWTSLLALIGLADRYLSRPRPAFRYLADSSYWIYISHMPAMVLIVALVTATTLGTAPQFALVTIASLAASLITYPLFVRYTAIGRMLNGPRARKGKAQSPDDRMPPLSGPPVATRSAAAAAPRA